MAYIFKEDELPSLIDAKAARERIFFVNQELANIDDMLAGVMHYKKDAASPTATNPRRCTNRWASPAGRWTAVAWSTC